MKNNQIEKVLITCGNSFHNTQEEIEVKVYGTYERLGGHQKVLEIVFPESNSFCTAKDCLCGRDYIITEDHPNTILDFIVEPAT
jgi:hypothetical protein